MASTFEVNTAGTSATARKADFLTRSSRPFSIVSGLFRRATVTERVALGTRTRFEVFKRDSFTCQYCGRAAPDIVLNVDHIKPVAEGGTNDLVNLITSCFSCNSGKSDIPLDDSSAVSKQKRQLDELQERRTQLEMMMEWHRGLIHIEADAAGEAAKLYHELCDFQLNDRAVAKLRKWISKFSLNEVIEAIKICADQYDDHNAGFDKIPGICNVRRVEKEKPWMKDVYKIRGFLKPRFNYFSDSVYFSLMEEAAELEIDFDSVYRIARDARSWTQFIDPIRRYVEKYKNEA